MFHAVTDPVFVHLVRVQVAEGLLECIHVAPGSVVKKSRQWLDPHLFQSSLVQDLASDEAVQGLEQEAGNDVIAVMFVVEQGVLEILSVGTLDLLVLLVAESCLDFFHIAELVLIHHILSLQCFDLLPHLLVLFKLVLVFFHNLSSFSLKSILPLSKPSRWSGRLLPLPLSDPQVDPALS